MKHGFLLGLSIACPRIAVHKGSLGSGLRSVRRAVLKVVSAQSTAEPGWETGSTKTKRAGDRPARFTR